jgi:hypothetical protein
MARESNAAPGAPSRISSWLPSRGQQIQAAVVVQVLSAAGSRPCAASRSSRRGRGSASRAPIEGVLRAGTRAAPDRSTGEQDPTSRASEERRTSMKSSFASPSGRAGGVQFCPPRRSDRPFETPAAARSRSVVRCARSRPLRRRDQQIGAPVAVQSRARRARRWRARSAPDTLRTWRWSGFREVPASRPGTPGPMAVRRPDRRGLPVDVGDVDAR